LTQVLVYTYQYIIAYMYIHMSTRRDSRALALHDNRYIRKYMCIYINVHECIFFFFTHNISTGRDSRGETSASAANDDTRRGSRGIYTHI